MSQIKINVTGGDISEAEKRAYLDRAVELYGTKHALKEMTIILDKDDPENVTLKYVFAKQPFDRIRRITGYLVGTVDRWNDGKKAELRDRTTHLEAHHHCSDCQSFVSEHSTGVGWCRDHQHDAYHSDEVCGGFSNKEEPDTCC